MTDDEFRAIVLALPGAEERSHMGHPDFRVNGRIFATLGAPGSGWGMVQLTPELQRVYILSHPDVFRPAPGAWGTGGSTQVRLAVAATDEVAEAAQEAWRHISSKKTKPR